MGTMNIPEGYQMKDSGRELEDLLTCGIFHRGTGLTLKRSIYISQLEVHDHRNSESTNMPFQDKLLNDGHKV